MSTFKYIKRGVKRKHNMIANILPICEQIAKIEGIKKVIPAKISYSPTRNIDMNGPNIRFQRDTVSGFKLLAHGKGSVQEIFVVINESDREIVRHRLIETIKRKIK